MLRGRQWGWRRWTGGWWRSGIIIRCDMNAAMKKGKEMRNAVINRRYAILSWLLAATALLTSAVVEAGSIGFAASNLARAVYAEDQPDLRVKVLGGQVAVQRTFVDGAWYPNLAWKKLIFTFDNLDGSVTEIDRSSIKYKKTSSGIYTAQADRRTFIKPTATGFRWQDREGFWIDYDAQGDIVAYGDRNDVKVSFNYEPAGAGKRMRSIADHFGTEVIFFEYTDNRLTAIRDYTNRRVQYHYDADGNMDRVIDVLGNTWSYGYTRSVYTDVKCDIRYEYRNGNLEEVFRNCVPITIVEDKFRLVSSMDPEGRTVTRGFTTNGFLGSVSQADGTKTENTYDYDSSKRQHYVREKSPGGRITESWLDEDGDVIRKDVNGRTISALTKDTAARTRTETDARGLKTIREYDQWDNVTKITHPDGATVSTTYDPAFLNVTQKIDERGVITKYEYDAKGNLAKHIEAVGRPEQRITEYTYDQYGQRLTETKRGGTVTLPDNTPVTTPDATTGFEYDASGNLTAIIDPEGFRTEWSNHDAIGYPRTKRDARQKVWTTTYDAKGMVTSESNPLGHTHRIEYDKVGRRKKTVDAVNNEILYGYDARGNLIAVTDPYGGIVRFEYNADNQQTKQADQDARSETTEYDLDGRVVKRVDGNGNVTQYTYGDVTSGLDSLIIKTVYPTFSQEYKYDVRGRIVEVIDVLDATTRSSSKTVYDAAGHRTSTTDKEGQATTYTYDALGRLSTVTDPASGITTYAYDQRNNLIALRDPKNPTHRFDYDRRSLRTREVRPRGQAIVYTYIATGQLDSVADPKGQVKHYVYDDAGRRTGETHHPTAPGPAVKTVTYTYNNLGNLTGYNDGTTQGTASYDTRALRKTGETVNYGTFSLSYSYDYQANGLKKSFTGPDGVTVNYTYDTNNQLNAIQLPSGSLTVNTYQWYWPTQTTLPGGTIRTQAYDSLMRLTAINVKGPAQNPVLNYQYGYDKADNIIQKATEHGTYNYTYDNLYRLTGATNPTPLTNETYTYDPVGNRLTDSNITGSWQYNSNNQLTQAGGNIVFTHDSNGNLITKTEGLTITTYVWDTFDRLTEVRDTNNNPIATYYYDPFGRRLWKEVNNTRIYFFYADEGLIAEASATGTLTISYGYRPGGTWSTDAVYLKTNNQYYFFQSDHLGTSQKLLASDGTVVWGAKAQAFGQTVVDAGSTITNNLRFPGQYFDQETEMHYNWFRYYDPHTGRYITSDPIGFRGGLNTYSYVKANPIAKSDPSGLKPYIFQWGVGGGVGHYVVGGSVYQLKVTDPIKGRICTYTVYCAGLGVGLPEFSLISMHETWDDGKDCSECDQFGGYGSSGFAAATVLVGLSFRGWTNVPNGPTLTSGDNVVNVEKNAGVRIGTAISMCRFALN